LIYFYPSRTSIFAQGWWSKRLRSVQFFTKSKQKQFICVNTKYKNVIFYKLKPFGFAKKFEGKNNFFCEQINMFQLFKALSRNYFFNGL